MRRLTFAFMGLFVVAIAVWAGEPWQQKSYREWDEVDLKRILFDSPWSRQVNIHFDMVPNIGANTQAGGASAATHLGQR